MSLTSIDLLPKGLRLEDLPLEHAHALLDLIEAMNQVEAFYVKECEGATPFLVTSGYRTLEHHEAIYKRINDRRILMGEKPIATPMGSKHLTGHAVDISDKDRKLGTWVALNKDRLIQMKFCFEHLEACKDPSPWVHFQYDAPVASGSFFFWP